MKIEKEVLEELAQNYNTTINHVSRFYNMTKDIPVVLGKSEDEYLEFLELLIQDRTSEVLVNEIRKGGYDPKTLDYSISDALYRVYGDDALDYLSDEYKEVNSTRYHM